MIEFRKILSSNCDPIFVRILLLKSINSGFDFELSGFLELSSNHDWSAFEGFFRSGFYRADVSIDFTEVELRCSVGGMIIIMKFAFSDRNLIDLCAWDPGPDVFRRVWGFT